ncbi:MAG TPA: hypothetical protein VFU47_02870, partial [Armatimonadota bacterium]|nr:hypothetical protein [Armatimonadota bacterium]
MHQAGAFAEERATPTHVGTSPSGALEVCQEGEGHFQAAAAGGVEPLRRRGELHADGIRQGGADLPHGGAEGLLQRAADVLPG